MNEESTRPKDRPSLLEALMGALRDVSGQSVVYSQAVAARLGVNSTDLECLGHITARGPITAGGLAEATGLTSGAITGVIDRLERAGYAVRQADPGDRRKVLVRASPAVQARVAPLFAPMARAAEAALSPYSDEELQLLLGFLDRAQQAGLAAMAELRDLPQPAPKRTRP